MIQQKIQRLLNKIETLFKNQRFYISPKFGEAVSLAEDVQHQVQRMGISQHVSVSPSGDELISKFRDM